MKNDELEALREQYRRVAAAAAAVVDGARAGGNPTNPICLVEPHLIRILRRELANEPQPHSKLTWMGSS